MKVSINVRDLDWSNTTPDATMADTIIETIITPAKVTLTVEYHLRWYIPIDTYEIITHTVWRGATPLDLPSDLVPEIELYRMETVPVVRLFGFLTFSRTVRQVYDWNKSEWL